MDKQANDIGAHIVPLNMNGMNGRMLRLAAPKNRQREILLIYGHHASIERMQGVAEELNKYGAITLPDLPGLGGMDSFYKIGEKPSLDNMADYLASFVRMRYKRKRVSIFAMSFGFVVVTRMLQRYPDIAKKVDLLISVVGFVHHEDFLLKPSTMFQLNALSWIGARRIPAAITKHLILRGPLIRAVYLLVADKHVKMKDADPAERDRRIDFEIQLWKMNDIRTYMDNSQTMLHLDLCNERVDLPVWHIAVEPDRYFDNRVVEQHMNIVYNEVTVVQSKMAGHAPTVVATAKEAAPFIPQKIRRLLTKKQQS
jgi:pimeloyl-ACP methyl ester carboxylesterase